MRGATWVVLLTGIVMSVLSMPSSETNVRRVNPDGSEVEPSASSSQFSLSIPHKDGHGNNDLHGDLQGQGGIHFPLVHHAIPQLALLLQLLQLVLDVIYKSPQFAQFALLASHNPPPPYGHLGNHKLSPHGGHGGGIPPPLYGNGLYGVSATNSLGKGRPFGPYKYEDNQKKNGLQGFTTAIRVQEIPDYTPENPDNSNTDEKKTRCCKNRFKPNNNNN